RGEPAREVAENLHLEGKNSRVVEEAFGEAHPESDLEYGEDDDREDHRDRADPPDLVTPEPPCKETHVERGGEVEAERRKHRVCKVRRPPPDAGDKHRIEHHRHSQLQDGEQAPRSFEGAFVSLWRRERAVRDDDRSEPHDRGRPERVPARADVAWRG